MRIWLIIRRVLVVALLAGAAWLLVGLIEDLSRLKSLKTDLAEIHHVRYGLLDAEEWLDRLSGVIDKRIDALELDGAARAQLTEAVTRLLDTLIREIERDLRQRGPSGGGTWLDQLQGVLQKGLQELLLEVSRLRERVPQYADALVEQLSLPGVKEQLKSQLKALLRQAVDTSSAAPERTRLESVLTRHACTDVEVCTTLLQGRIETLRPDIQIGLGAVLGLVATLFLVALVGPSVARTGAVPSGSGGPLDTSSRTLDPLLLGLLTGATLLLLIGGLATPMIAVDARITELTFRILGEPVVFTDQVLYFQTKSIFDVMRILFESGKPDMLLVAVLLTLFSIIFPALKLIATHLYYHDPGGIRGLALIRFFALRSGKWSMADVMVVAIFMAYIGFDALVANQLASLRGGSDAVDVLTTNGTTLEPGFFLFLAFVLAGLILSGAVERGSPRDQLGS